MDFVGTAWAGYMSEIQTNCNVGTEQEIGINQYMAKMKHLLKKKSNLYWHIEFLNKYIRENISPLGVRIQIYPSFQAISPEFKVAWENTLTTCSTNLMKILVTQYQSELITLDQEIVTLQSSNENIKTHALYTKLWQDIKDFVTKITRDIIYKKQNKLSKDRLAFMERFANHWQVPSQNKGSRTKHHTSKNHGNVPYTTDDDTESDSSLFPSQPVSRKKQSARSSHSSRST